MKSVSETGSSTGSRMRSSGSSISRATFSKAVSALALAAIFGLTACDNDYTLAFVYAPSETNTTSGLINAYGIDNQTGSLRLLADSPIPSGGRKPVAIAVAPNQKAVYVINHDDSNVVELSIGTDGKLYPQNTYNTSNNNGSYPTSPRGLCGWEVPLYRLHLSGGVHHGEPGPGRHLHLRHQQRLQPRNARRLPYRSRPGRHRCKL